MRSHSLTADGSEGDGVSGTPQVGAICTLRNEGGLQQGLDIPPLLVEEQHLKRHPEERRARAFLKFCREGDLGAVVEILQDDEDDDDDVAEDSMDHSNKVLDILWYQDVPGDMQSALHAAVVGGSVK